jgi:hypothetical protein
MEVGGAQSTRSIDVRRLRHRRGRMRMAMEGRHRGGSRTCTGTARVVDEVAGMVGVDGVM